MSQKATDSLKGFQLQRVLNEDPRTRSAALLGTFQTADGASESAVVLLEKTHFQQGFYATIGQVEASSNSLAGESIEPAQKAARTENGSQNAASAANTSTQSGPTFSRLELLNQNDIYTWMLGWTAGTSSSPADVKVSIIRPASESHIVKHSAQALFMVNETPALYKDKVEPWIASQPVSRINWVYNILEKKKESESIVHEDTDPETGFIILPDLKWDQKTLSSLHLTAIVQDRTLKSIRDLKPVKEHPKHAELLRKVRSAATQLASERYGLKESAKGGNPLRCYFHYHPTYYHMHIHITSADNVLQPGALVGKAYLLEDVLDQLELGVDFKQRTLSYQIGERSELWDVISS